MKNVILGFATNMPKDAVTIFLRSARKVHPAAEVDIVVFTNDAAPLMDVARETGTELVQTISTYGRPTGRLERYARRIFLETLRSASYFRRLSFTKEFSEGYFALMEVWQHPHITRWNTYRNFLRFGPSYQYIALCDVKDVLFQSSAFDNLPSNAVLIGEDSTPMSGNDVNSLWIIEAFGRGVWSKFAGKTPLCVGVIIGPGVLIQRMVEQFHAAFFRAPFGKVEQALFNRMYFELSFDVPILALPNGQRIATLSNEWVNDFVDYRDGIILDRISRTPYPIVHMYDRFPDICKIVRNVNL